MYPNCTGYPAAPGYPSGPGQPPVAQAMPAAQPQLQTMQLQVPQGMMGGMLLQVQAPTGVMQV